MCTYQQDDVGFSTFFAHTQRTHEEPHNISISKGVLCTVYALASSKAPCVRMEVFISGLHLYAADGASACREYTSNAGLPLIVLPPSPVSSKAALQTVQKSKVGWGKGRCAHTTHTYTHTEKQGCFMYANYFELVNYCSQLVILSLNICKKKIRENSNNLKIKWIF